MLNLVQILGVMPKIARCSFDVKCLGLAANQDAGALTKDGFPTLRDCRVTFWSQYCLFCDFDVNAITTYGGGAFKTGDCIGYLVIEFYDSIGNPYYLSVVSFDEVKTGGRAYFRFRFPLRETVSQQYIG